MREIDNRTIESIVQVRSRADHRFAASDIPYIRRMPTIDSGLLHSIKRNYEGRLCSSHWLTVISGWNQISREKIKFEQYFPLSDDRFGFYALNLQAPSGNNLQGLVGVNNEELNQVSEALQVNSRVRKLMVSFNEPSVAEINALVALLNTNKQIMDLEIRINFSISKNALAQLCEALVAQLSLQSLLLSLPQTVNGQEEILLPLSNLIASTQSIRKIWLNMDLGRDCNDSLRGKLLRALLEAAGRSHILRHLELRPGPWVYFEDLIGLSPDLFRRNPNLTIGCPISSCKDSNKLQETKKVIANYSFYTLTAMSWPLERLAYGETMPSQYQQTKQVKQYMQSHRNSILSDMVSQFQTQIQAPVFYIDSSSSDLRIDFDLLEQLLQDNDSYLKLKVSNLMSVLAADGQLHHVQRLLDLGFDPLQNSLQRNRCNHSPLYYALELGFEAIAIAMLAKVKSDQIPVICQWQFDSVLQKGAKREFTSYCAELKMSELSKVWQVRLKEHDSLSTETLIRARIEPLKREQKLDLVLTENAELKAKNTAMENEIEALKAEIEQNKRALEIESMANPKAPVSLFGTF